MKKHIISVALCLALGAPLFAQTAYLNEISLDNRRVEKVAGRMVQVSMDLNLDRLDIKRQHSLELVPVLVSADGANREELPPVIIEGKVRNKVNRRAESIGNVTLHPDAQATVRRKNGSEQTVHYEASVPFKRWMIGSELQLEGRVNGCAQCEEGNETAYTGDVLPPMTPQYATPFLTPKEETVKRRSETRAARLQFRQNSDKIRPGYKDNAAELDKVRESLTLVKENKDLTITGIYVTGYASPEGTMAYNMKLSERRAKAFTEYMKQDMKDVDASLYHVDWKGEDWDELRRQVELHPHLLKIEDVLNIIDNCGDDKDACEEQIKALVPPTIYQRLLNEMYGPVRRNEYRIEYNVRHFDLEEGRQMIKTRPELMSVSEIQKVADSYGKGSAEYIDCLVRGAKAYPNDVTAVNNAALALIEADRAEEAVALLKSAPEEDALLNMLGVAYMKTNRPDAAREAFRRAADKGYTQAAGNSRLMDAYLEYMAE